MLPRYRPALAALLVAVSCADDPAPPPDGPGTPPPAVLTGLAAFLDECPTEDPATAEILQDFSIWRDMVRVESFPCSGKVSELPIEAWTQELVLLQTLRTAYHLQGTLPWAGDTLYGWMRSKLSGFDIKTGWTIASCCFWPPGELPRMSFGDAPADQRDQDRRPEGILLNLGLLAHETRHVDGYPHASCCAAGSGACDAVHDEANLTAYGVQRALLIALRDGTLPTGYGCQPRKSVIAGLLEDAADGAASRFCEGAPPPLDPSPPAACAPAPPFETGG